MHDAYFRPSTYIYLACIYNNTESVTHLCDNAPSIKSADLMKSVRFGSAVWFLLVCFSGWRDKQSHQRWAAWWCYWHPCNTTLTHDVGRFRSWDLITSSKLWAFFFSFFFGQSTFLLLDVNLLMSFLVVQVQSQTTCVGLVTTYRRHSGSCFVSLNITLNLFIESGWCQTCEWFCWDMTTPT